MLRPYEARVLAWTAADHHSSDDAEHRGLQFGSGRRFSIPIRRVVIRGSLAHEGDNSD